QQSRRVLRAAAKAGARLEVAGNQAEARAFYDDLVRLHQHRWNTMEKPGCFAARRLRELHQSLAERWVPAGKAVLVRLVVNETVGVIYGFVVGTKFDFYQSGVLIEEDSPLSSPGITGFL